MGSAIELRKRGADPKQLTSNQQLFVKELLADGMFNPTAAARKAGYKQPANTGAKLMKDKRIQAILGKALRERMERLDMDGDALLKELEYSAMRDPLDLCDENGQIVINDLSKIPERMRRCINGIKVKNFTDRDGNTEQTIEIRLTDKLAAIELAMKHFGMLAPQQHNINVAANINWDDLYKRGEVVDHIENEILALEEE